MTINKKVAVTLFSAAALAAALAVPRVFSQINVQIGGGGHHHDHGHHFDHPEIDAAMAHLNEARGSLNNAAHDFGGHKVQALHNIDEAIRHCQKAIEYANTHDR